MVNFKAYGVGTLPIYKNQNVSIFSSLKSINDFLKFTKFLILFNNYFMIISEFCIVKNLRFFETLIVYFLCEKNINTVFDTKNL